MSYSEIIEKVAEELNLPTEIVAAAHKGFFLFVREGMSSLPLKENISEEEFSKLRTNFNIPALGKFNCTYSRMRGVKQRYELIKKIRNGRLAEETGGREK